MALTPTAVDRLPELEMPILVVTGDQDVAGFQEISQLIATRVINGKQVVISGAGHLPAMEKSEAFNRIVLEFLAA